MISRVKLESIDVVVLCGGRGTRLGALTVETPKPLLPVRGRPFLLHRLLALRQEGCARFVLAAHYLAEQFRDFARRYAAMLPDVTVVEESEPLGTGGALQYAVSQVRSPVFVAVNGDSWGLQPVAPVLGEHERKHAVFTMVVVRAPRVEGGARAKGLVATGPGDEITGFSTPDATGKGWVNAGCYVLNKDLVLGWPPGRYDLERNFMTLVPPGRGYVFRSAGSLLDIGTPDCYARAEALLGGAQPATETLPMGVHA